MIKDWPEKNTPSVRTPLWYSLIVHAVGDHHGLEHINTTHGSACKEEAQPGKDHPYHRGLYIAVSDLKEHIQQGKRHGAGNGIEVINALFLVLANQ